MRKSLPCSNEQLIRLYVSDHLTMQEIADKLKITRQAVWNRLNWLGVKAEQGERVSLNCDFCGKIYEIPRSKWKKGTRYCSQDCYFLARFNPQYRQDRHCQRLARVIVSQHFPLAQEHVVHHKDGNNKNNNIDNLAVFASQSDHLIFHHGRRKILPAPIWDGANDITKS